MSLCLIYPMPLRRRDHPIREVSRLTGVNAVTLRAWQRRYGLVQPAPYREGHRLYSEQDIRQIGGS